jgi:hypothetical protein
VRKKNNQVRQKKLTLKLKYSLFFFCTNSHPPKPEKSPGNTLLLHLGRHPCQVVRKAEQVQEIRYVILDGTCVGLYAITVEMILLRLGFFQSPLKTDIIMT